MCNGYLVWEQGMLCQAWVVALSLLTHRCLASVHYRCLTSDEMSKLVANVG